LIIVLVVLISLIYSIRLLSLQVLDLSYKLSADNNATRYVAQYPARGRIYDRRNRLLVYNEAAYDLLVIPNQMNAFDTTELCSIIDFTKEELLVQIQKARKYSYYKPSVIVKQLSAKVYAVLQEKIYKYQGFFVQTRTLRKYPLKTASHILGYLGEVDENIIKNSKYYKIGDYIGINGIEKSYEEELRGVRGVKIYLVDVHNRIKGSYKDGKYDKQAIAGNNLVLSIDEKLQEYGEKLMQNKIGSIVVIEPETGEILALISSPTYNPELLVGRVKSINYSKLVNDSLKPLFNRALMAQYPPGSTFKIVNGLIGLKEKIIKPSSRFRCSFGYRVGNFYQACHHDTAFNLISAIQNSCNAYFSMAFRNILDDKKMKNISESLENWRRDVISLGLGNKLNCDLPNEVNGFIPSAKFYDRRYGRGRWKSLMLVAMGIGQGELLTTPIQMANLAAIIANRGFYYTPHIVKKIEGKDLIDQRFLVKRYTLFDSSQYKVIIEGMDKAVNGGYGSTAVYAALPNIRICGKTGTAENPHGEDHSIFMAFAPKDNPKIAIAVYVENGGYGATWAAPITSLMIEKYLCDTISRKYYENRILEANLLDRGRKEKHN